MKKISVIMPALIKSKALQIDWRFSQSTCSRAVLALNRDIKLHRHRGSASWSHKDALRWRTACWHLLRDVREQEAFRLKVIAYLHTHRISYVGTLVVCIPDLLGESVHDV